MERYLAITRLFNLVYRDPHAAHMVFPACASLSYRAVTVQVALPALTPRDDFGSQRQISPPRAPRPGKSQDITPELMGVA
eukprot:7077378-Prymnesium_polylepis.1